MSMKESDQTTLESAFQKMLNPQIVQESSKKPEKVIEESKTEETPTEERVVEENNEETEVLGSRFNQVFQKVFATPSIQEEEVEGDLEVSFEDEEEEPLADEETMVSVPEALIKELYGYKSPQYGAAMNDIGILLDGQGKYDEALEYYKEAVSIQKNSLGSNHPNVASSLGNIGIALTKQDKWDEALKYYEESLAIKQKSLGVHHPSVALSLVNIG